MTTKYDVLIIGAGMSGMAAGIRLAMFGKTVCIAEMHSLPGGLNSFYQRGSRKFDVGLHALTNFVKKGTKGHPLSKILKQLRIRYDSLQLKEQKSSKVQFRDLEINFSNDIELLISQVAKNFPEEVDGFLELIKNINIHKDLLPSKDFKSARQFVGQYIKNKMLEDMIFYPILFYGSSTEHDLDVNSFIILFQSVYLEGFSRPMGGVRTIIDILLDKFNALGGELRYRHKVEKIVTKNSKVQGALLNNGEMIEADYVISSIGYPETMSLVESQQVTTPAVGRISPIETIFIFDKKPAQCDIDSTIIYYSNQDRYNYQKPTTAIDETSTSICLPNNFSDREYDEGVIRLTSLANFDLWDSFKSTEYKAQKQKVVEHSLETLKAVMPSLNGELKFQDVFTPKTIKRFTGHMAGAVYGSPDKLPDGLTGIENLLLCGTDQGLIGIVGTLLSGITISNMHILTRDWKG